jgi:DNA-binding PadR family transcriptional regulator
MRRRPGQLTSLELSIIEAVLSLSSRDGGVYGFVIAKEMKRLSGAKYRTAHGTLYKTLERLERNGLLKSDWEDASPALEEGRPRRRLYELTAEGEASYREALRVAGRRVLQAEPGGGAA